MPMFYKKNRLKQFCQAGYSKINSSGLITQGADQQVQAVQPAT